MKRLDRLEAHLQEIKDTLVRNTSSLEEHMKRTEILEERVLPLERAHSFVTLSLKAIPLITAVCAAIYYITRI